MYTVVSLNIDLAGEPDTIDFTLALFYHIFSFFIHLCELWRSVLPLPCAQITHFVLRYWRNNPGFVRFIPALRGTVVPLFCLPPFFFCLAELQFREPFPSRLHVFLGGFLGRGWLQHKIGIGVTGTRRYFTLEPAQTRAFQEENPRRVGAGPRGESSAQDRRWAAASRWFFEYAFKIWPMWGFRRWILPDSPHFTSSYCGWVGVVPSSAVGCRFGMTYVMAFWWTLILDTMAKI